MNDDLFNHSQFRKKSRAYLALFLGLLCCLVFNCLDKQSTVTHEIAQAVSLKNSAQSDHKKLDDAQVYHELQAHCYEALRSSAMPKSALPPALFFHPLLWYCNCPGDFIYANGRGCIPQASFATLLKDDALYHDGHREGFFVLERHSHYISAIKQMHWHDLRINLHWDKLQKISQKRFLKDFKQKAIFHLEGQSLPPRDRSWQMTFSNHTDWVVQEVFKQMRLQDSNYLQEILIPWQPYADEFATPMKDLRHCLKILRSKSLFAAVFCEQLQHLEEIVQQPQLFLQSNWQIDDHSKFSTHREHSDIFKIFRKKLTVENKAATPPNDMTLSLWLRSDIVVYRLLTMQYKNEFASFFLNGLGEIQAMHFKTMQRG